MNEERPRSQMHSSDRLRRNAVTSPSPESQLAQSVSAQQMKPIKAFVVGKEITNQQEFDRNIITTSALGN